MRRIVLLVVLGLTGCSSSSEHSEEHQPVTVLPQAREVVGEELMLCLAQAKNFHHKADVYLGDANLRAAIEAVEKILAVPCPPLPEAADAALDARARLAKLLVLDGRLDAAMEVVDAGLAEAVRESFFLANLHTVRGEIWEARAALLDERDASPEASAARRAAIEAYDRSIAINEALQRRILEETR